MIRVLIVDDQPMIRRAIADILGAEPDITVVGEAANGIAAISGARSLEPDIIVMDLRMPELDGIAATARICGGDAPSRARVLVLTTFEEDANVVAALRAGASGFIGKGAEPDEIVRAVRAVHEGEALLSPAATRGLIARFLDAPSVADREFPGLSELTEREREVLVLVARGMSNADIAAGLVISPHTAKTHVNRVMAKLQAHDRAQLVIVAYESGLLTPGGASDPSPGAPDGG